MTVRPSCERSPMTGFRLFLGFLSSTLFVDFETRVSLAFLLDSGLI